MRSWSERSCGREFLWLFFLGGLLLSCADEPDDDPGATRLANTVPGHADVQVTGSYRGDDIGGANDQDPIGSRACTNPSYNRGCCYRGEAMATAGPYTLALYGEWLVAPPRPLFLTILDAS